MEQLSYTNSFKKQQPVNFRPLVMPAPHALKKPKLIQKSTKAAEAHRRHQVNRFPRLHQLRDEEGWNNDTKTSGWFNRQLKAKVIIQKQQPVKQPRELLPRPCRCSKSKSRSRSKSRQEDPYTRGVRCVGQEDTTFDRERRMAPHIPQKPGRPLNLYGKNTPQPVRQSAAKETAGYTHQEALKRKLQSSEQISQLIKKTVSSVREYSLIPFLEKASHRLISIHNASITELIVDDLLEETALLLNSMEQAQSKQRQRKQRGQLLDEFSCTVRDYFEETREIQQRLQNSYQLERGLVVNPFVSLREVTRQMGDHHTKAYAELTPLETIALSLPQPCAHSIQRHAARYAGSLNKEHYGPSLEKIERILQEIEEQVFEQIVQEVDKGSDQIVQMLFQNEFR